MAAERLRLPRSLDRLKVLFLEGDPDRYAYRAHEAAITEQIAALPPVGEPDAGAGKRPARSRPTWRAATEDERNRLARQSFGQVIRKNKTVVAVVPRPELVPFFDLVAVKGVTAEATGVGSAPSEPARRVGPGSAPRPAARPPLRLAVAGVLAVW